MEAASRKDLRLRPIQAVGAVIAAACCMLSAPPSAAVPDTWCAADLGGSWDAQNGFCSAAVTSNRNATMSISMAIPGAMLDDPTAGPAIRSYARDLAGRWRNTGETMVRDSTATEDYALYSHSDGVKSIVFHESWQTVGLTANNAYRTFTFDLAHAKRLELADLVIAGVDPLTAIPPLARPFLTEALDQAPPPHSPNTYPFTSQQWEPHPDGSGYSTNYRAFALTADDLILYMPESPMAHESPIQRGQLVWSMDGGTTTVRVPLSALTTILRPI